MAPTRKQIATQSLSAGAHGTTDPAPAKQALRAGSAIDLPTRFFHAINAILVIALIALGIVLLKARSLGIGSDDWGRLNAIHALLGHFFLLNLIWRAGWAACGGRCRDWRARALGERKRSSLLAAYASAFLAGRPHPNLILNPLARLGGLVILILLIAQTATGLVMAWADFLVLPIADWLARPVLLPGPGLILDGWSPPPAASVPDWRIGLAMIHLYSFFVILCAIALHVAAVLATGFARSGSLLPTLFTGCDVSPERTGASGED